MTTPAAAFSQLAADISGRALDVVSNQPVAGAAVVLRPLGVAAWRITAVTNQDGTFVLRRILPGTYRVEATAPSYVTYIDSVLISADAAPMLTIKLQPDPLFHGEVVAEAERQSANMRGFYDRMKAGVGVFFTRADLDKLKPRALSDVLRTVPGARVQAVSAASPASHVEFGRSQCNPAFYVDGVPQILGPAGLQDFAPEDIEGLEVYSGSSRVPAQFNRTGTKAGASKCGVIVIWTRKGA